ncbi:MAG: hypothetical protein K2Q03_02950 [Sphingobacteriaceae bacterium]|nr:hypothetical protein [Sphingobacteriaceae bacterium]
MKKILTLFLAVTLLGLSSCQKDTIINQTTPNRTIVVDIRPDQWVLSSNGLTYSADLKIREIDAFHIQNEGTLVYMSYEPVGGSATGYQQLPFVYDVDAFSYSVYPGGLSVDIQSLDYQATTPMKPVKLIRFKIVLVAAVNVT